MDAKFKEFLEDRKVSAEVIQRLIEDKVDASIIPLLSDEQLKSYFPCIGDRVAIRNYCKKTNNNNPSKKYALIDILKKKMNRGKKKKRNTVSSSSNSESDVDEKKKKKIEPERLIEIGWFCGNAESMKQVRTRGGGGTRKIKVPGSSKKDYLLQRAMQLFFPRGNSSKGSQTDFEFEIWDFKGNRISEDLTVSELYNMTGLTRLRFYLAAIRKPDSDLTNTISLPSTPLENNEGTIENEGTIQNEGTIENEQPSCSNAAATTSNAQVVYLIEQSELTPLYYETVDSKIFETDVDVEPTLAQSASTSRSRYYISSDEDEDPSVLDLPRLAEDSPEKHLLLRRGNIVEDMFSYYSKEDISSFRLKIEFQDESGTDVGGLTKEAFSLFFKEITTNFFAGENVIVPYLSLYRLRKEKAHFTVIGKILDHCMYLTNTLPHFAKSVFLKLCNPNVSIPRDVVIDDFLNYVSPREKFIVEKALNDFDNLTDRQKNEVDSFLTSNGLFELGKKDEFCEQLYTIAENVIISNPRELINEMRKGINIIHFEEFWKELTVEKISKILKNQRPSARALIDVLKTNDTLTNDEEKVLTFLKNYLYSLCFDDLQKFLFFVTGSYYRPTEINLSFVNLVGNNLRPIAHTCSNTLELSIAYNNYSEFKRNMNLFLNNEFTFIYSQM